MIKREELIKGEFNEFHLCQVTSNLNNIINKIIIKEII